MKWIETEVKLNDLKEYERNPRRISKDQLDRLVKSIHEDGYHNRIAVDIDNVIIGGHARKRALKKAGFKDGDLIKVLKPERKLTEQEFDRINLRDNGRFGDWDLDGLANFGYDIEQLIDWGIPDSLFNELKETEVEDKLPKEKKDTTCPNCGEIFKAK